MVLSEKFGGKPRPSLWKKTLLYVLGFGLGALVVAGGLSFTAVAVAEGVLPKSKTSTSKRADDADKPTAKAVKARRPRVNEAAGEKKSAQPL